MHKATKALLKDLIEFYEGCGRDRRKTISHFSAKPPKVAKQKLWKLLRKYIRLGPAIWETKPQKKRTLLVPDAAEVSKKVLNLLKEDPNITTSQGAQILGIGRATFFKHKKRLLTPGQLTTEMKIQLGVLPPPAPPPPPPVISEDKKQNGVPSVKLEVEESANPENFDADDLDSCANNFDSFDCDDILPENGPENEETEIKSEPTTAHVRKSRGRPKGKTSKKQHCMICYVRVDNIKPKSGNKATRFRSSDGDSDRSTAPHPFISKDDDELSKNLNTIFALKHIFGLNSSDLIKFLKISKGKDPHGWYDLCSECRGIMNEAVAIQYKVLQLTKYLEQCKSRIKEKVKESCRRGMGRVKKGDHQDDLLVTKLIRESICPRKKKKVKDCSSGGTSKMKTEPEHLQVEEDSSPQWEPSSDFGDHGTTETANNTVTVEPETNTPITSTSEETVALGNADEGEGTSLTEHDKGDMNTDTADILLNLIGNPNGKNLNELKVKPKLVVCDLCGEETRVFELPLHTLRVHGVLMDGYTEFKCPEVGCSYKTVYKCNFIAHKTKVHVPLNKRNWTCQFCGKKFKCNQHLRAHENCHKNAITRPYQCEICGQGFAVNATLWNHIKGVHQGRLSPYRKRLKARKMEKTKIASTPTPPPTDSNFKTDSSSFEPQHGNYEVTEKPTTYFELGGV